MYSRNAVRYDSYGYNYNPYSYGNAVTMPAKPQKEKKAKPLPMPKPKRKKKASLFQKLVVLTLLSGLGYLMVPTSYNMFT